MPAGATDRVEGDELHNLPRCPRRPCMIDIFTGFAVIALAVFVGWIAGRTGVLGPEARPMLARLNFSVLAPFLLFSVLAEADVGALFSVLLPVSAIAAVAMMLVFGLVAMLVWRRSLEHLRFEHLRRRRLCRAGPPDGRGR